MATIIQDYGPIYGEVVNGTVQGRPNGSVYVPITNTIDILSDVDGVSISGTYIVLAKSGVSTYSNIVAVAQDLASNVVCELYDDAACTNLIASRSFAAGLFNVTALHFAYGSPTITTGTKYYARAQLFNNGVPVATSSVKEVVGL